MLRGQNLKVSFAKYDKNGRNDFALQETGKAFEPMWREHRKGKYTERSFKEVVAGLPFLLKAQDQVLKNHNSVEDSNDTKERLELDKLNIKGMVWRVVEEVFKLGNIEELKRKIGDLMEEALMVEPLVHKETVEVPRMKGKEVELGVFLEEELILSMKHKYQDGASSLISAFEPVLAEEGSKQC